MSVVLVSGVSRYLGTALARQLAADPAVSRVIGVDVVPPRADIGGAEFIRADIRTPEIADVLAESGADTVAHLGVIATPLQAGSRSAMKDINVIGTMHLLAACQQVPKVRRLVVKSTSAVYGAGPRDPAAFTEATDPRHPPASGWAKDSVEVEDYVRSFGRRRSDVEITLLRFANVIGPNVETTLTNYFAMPVLPTVLGFDARLQFVHESDLLAVLQRACTGSYPGTFNVAGPGVLLLSQAARLAGRGTVGLPAPLVGVVGGWFRRAGIADYSTEQLRLLTYGRVLDLTALRTKFGYEPRWRTREAFCDFVSARLVDRTLPRHQLEAVEAGIAHAFGQRTLAERRAGGRSDA